MTFADLADRVNNKLQVVVAFAEGTKAESAGMEIAALLRSYWRELAETEGKFDIAAELAHELHRQYRAAEKALAGMQLDHDHGFKNCPNKKYFYKRAQEIIRRSKIDKPTTLGEAEQALAASVLKHRLFQGVKS